MRDHHGQDGGRTGEEQVECLLTGQLCLQNITCLCRHEQLKQEEKTMEDQIKVNAEAVESLIRILSK